MRQSSYQWQQLETELQTAALDQIISALDEMNLPTSLAPLFARYDLANREQIEKFVHTPLESLYDPYLLFDMDKTVERIQKAVAEQEHILIYGDYDADGMTSATVMKEAIELTGGMVSVYLPNRFTDGYGPNQERYAELIEQGVQLIVTVDNGVSGHQAIAYAMEQGVDVIVTDHHELPEELPNAYSIVHPAHPQGKYPFPHLAGVGVAFKVACALLEDVPYELLDLVAIGTVADLVSMTDENRILVKHGLKVIHQTERVGLHTLCQKAGVAIEEATEESIGFSLAPRLNALGRLGDASPAVDLLTTFDDQEAEQLAELLEQKNQERQLLVKEHAAEALAMLEKQTSQPIQILAKKGWHEGILGIVASRLVERTGKPTIILTISQDGKTAKGSGRSIEQLNLFAAMTSASQYLTHFGGHHMAAGMTLPSENIADLTDALCQYVVDQQIDMDQKPTLKIDQTLSIEDITVAFIHSLKCLAPFGTDHPQPCFMIEPTAINQVKRIGNDLTHLKFQASGASSQLDCIAFQKGIDYREFETATEIQIVGQLSVNVWNGNQKPQMMVRDYAVHNLQIFDCRQHGVADLKPLKEEMTYLVSGQLTDSLSFLPSEQVVQLSQDVTLKSGEEAVIVDCPYNQDQLRQALTVIQPHRIFLWAKSQHEYYLNGLPTREQFIGLFKLLNDQAGLDVRYKGTQLANYLKIQPFQLTFMIHVFCELDFAVMEDGMLKKIAGASFRPLDQSQYYQAYQNKMATEKFFIYEDLDKISQWLTKQEENET